MSVSVEIVLFRLNAGVSPEQFLAAAKPTFDLLPRFDGYINRELSMSEDGWWVDVVHWRDMESALAASERIMADADGQAFGSLIDVTTIVMHHAAPQMSSLTEPA
ncbi:MAG: hypothetical protein SF123_13255 [Chloroflexota bacterium]|nr:hypothetical protein [Chloroflexota bacterium]